MLLPCVLCTAPLWLLLGWEGFPKWFFWGVWCGVCWCVHGAGLVPSMYVLSLAAQQQHVIACVAGSQPCVMAVWCHVAPGTAHRVCLAHWWRGRLRFLCVVVVVVVTAGCGVFGGVHCTFVGWVLQFGPSTPTTSGVVQHLCLAGRPCCCAVVAAQQAPAGRRCQAGGVCMWVWPAHIAAVYSPFLCLQHACYSVAGLGCGVVVVGQQAAASPKHQDCQEGTTPCRRLPMVPG